MRACVQAPGQDSCCRKPCSMVRNKPGLADAIRGRCTDMFSRTTVSVVLGRLQLPAVRYCISWARAGSNYSPSRASCGRYDGVPESHVESGQMGVANAMPGPGSENAMLGRRQVVQIHRQTTRLQGGCLFVLFWRRRDPHEDAVACFWRYLVSVGSPVDSCRMLR